MVLQPNYILTGQRAGLGTPFRKYQNQLEKKSSASFLFLQELIILGFQVLKSLLGPIVGKILDRGRELRFYGESARRAGRELVK